MTAKNAIVPILLAVIAGVIGIYWFQQDERKTEAPVTQGTAIGREYATGALAAFLVKPERQALPDIKFQDGDGKALSLEQWKGLRWFCPQLFSQSILGQANFPCYQYSERNVRS